MFFKKIACLMLALVTAAQPLVVQAVDLGGAFENLVGPGGAVSINTPGRFQSAARGGFSAGGVEMRVPRAGNVPQLVTASAPRISAGCNGISAHFGGFSFISGAEFGELLKQIASGAALGFVSSLVMKTLCPACEAVVQELKSAAQLAARLAKDSCEIGRKFGQDFMSGIGSGGTAVPETCASTLAAAGHSGDPLSAFGTICKTIGSARDALSSLNPLPPGATDAQKKEAKAKEDCELGTGNNTWRRLRAFDSSGIFGSVASDDYSRKLILLNLLGAEMVYAGSDTTVGCQNLGEDPWTAVGEAGKDKNFCRPPMDLQAFTGLFLCGADGASSGSSRAAKKYCDSLRPGGAEPQAWTCKNDKVNCPFLTLEPASVIFNGEGFFIRINKLLLSAVQRVRDGRGYDDDEGRQIISLIQAAPYPLYQAINAAAVYPSAATDLLDTMSVLVAEQYTHAVFDEMLRLEGRSANAMCLTREQATQILNFVGQLRTQNVARLSLLAQNFSIQQGLTEQIRQINLTIQRQVMSEDMLATGKLSESLNKALTTSSAGQNRPLPAAPQ